MLQPGMKYSMDTGLLGLFDRPMHVTCVGTHADWISGLPNVFGIITQWHEYGTRCARIFWLSLTSNASPTTNVPLHVDLEELCTIELSFFATKGFTNVNTLIHPVETRLDVTLPNLISIVPALGADQQ